MKTKVIAILLSILGLAIYVDLTPRLGLWLDRQLKLLWRLPRCADIAAGGLLLAGAVVAVWYFAELLIAGPGRAGSAKGESMLLRLRGRVTWGLWTMGAGMGLLLRSPSLMVLAALCAMGAEIWLRRGNGKAREAGPSLVARRMKGRGAVWITLTLVGVGTLAGFPRVSRSAPPERVTAPGILIQIRCKPGTADLWRADFDEHLRPAIEEAVGRKDSYTSFEFMEPALPGQGFDFALLYTGASFSGLDQPRIFPQYIALAEREGPVRALALSHEMGQWEDHVTVSLVHLSKTR
jgi:hypothetical protein